MRTTGRYEGITPQQKKQLMELIFERIPSREERNRWLNELNSGLSSFDAADAIASFLLEKRQ